MTPDLFGEAIVVVPRPSEPIVRRALVEGSYRRWLFRGWGAGPVALWAMLNPSMGDALRDDPTLWQIMKMSRRLGFGSLFVGNVYPLRSSSPADLRVWRVSFEAAAGRGEDRQAIWLRNIVDVAELCGKADAHFAAWGNEVPMASDLTEWLREVDRVVGGRIDWQCFGTTASGAPKHPLARGRHRIPDDARPVAWARPA